MFIPFLSSKIPGFSGNHLIILTFCVCPDSQDCKRMKHVTQLHCHVDVDFQQNPTTWFAAGKSWGRRPRPWGARSGGAACCWWGAEFFNTHFFCAHFPSKCLESQNGLLSWNSIPVCVFTQISGRLVFRLQFDRWFSAVSRSYHVLLLPEPWWLLYRRKAQRPNQPWGLCDGRPLREDHVKKSRN